MESAKRKKGSASRPKGANAHAHGNAAPFTPAPIKQDTGVAGDYKKESALDGPMCVKNATGTGRKI